MNISNTPNKLTCPHCLRTKYILALLSGNTFGAKLWSDGKWYFRWHRSPSPIQKCPRCGRYFFYEDGHPRRANPNNVEKRSNARPSWAMSFFFSKLMEDVMVGRHKKMDEACENGFGELTYRELIDAYQDIVKKRVSKEKLDCYYTLFLQTFNDARYGRCGVEKDEQINEYQERFEEIATEYIESLPEHKTMVAEVLRELGHFDQAIEICKQCIDGNIDVEVNRQIKEHAEQGDKEVFEVQLKDNENNK